MHAETPTISRETDPGIHPASSRIALEPGPQSGSPTHSVEIATTAPLLSTTNNRILVVDDNPAIHDDFRKVLSGMHQPQADLMSAEAALFGEEPAPMVSVNFEIESAYQGQEALLKVEQSVTAGKPYAMAFVDVRMPPGWDGIETVLRI